MPRPLHPVGRHALQLRDRAPSGAPVRVFAWARPGLYARWHALTVTGGHGPEAVERTLCGLRMFDRTWWIRRALTFTPARADTCQRCAARYEAERLQAVAREASAHPAPAVDDDWPF